MLVLGVSSFYHDSAAALVRDGEIIAAAQEERFTRAKHDPGLPANAMAYCLKEAKTDAGAVLKSHSEGKPKNTIVGPVSAERVSRRRFESIV